jgi:ankyrin repeat protein
MGQIDKDLLDASINGDLEKAIWAIEKGADVDAKHNEGNTPLHWKGQTPLCLASWKRHDSIVSLLLENGANVNVKDEDGCTPLHFASMEGQDAVVSLLLENGADVNAKNDYGNTPLHKAGYNGHEAVVSLLLEKGADRNITNYYGKTPLQIAQKYKKQNCVAAIEQFQPRFFTAIWMRFRLLYNTRRKMSLFRSFLFLKRL